jgi:hypothetical protein
MSLAVYDAYDPDVADGYFLIFLTSLGCWIAFSEAGRIYIRRVPNDVLSKGGDVLRLNSKSEVPEDLRTVFDVFMDLHKKGEVGRHMIMGDRGDVVVPFPASKKRRGHVLQVYGPSQAIIFAMESPAEIHFWDSVSSASPHATSDFTKAVSECLEDVWREWNWAPSKLVIKILGASQSVYGSARAPLFEESRRLICLNPKLLKEYSIDSIKRTILHELAHHEVYDEERESGLSIETHGDRFCELLAMVDPMSRGSKQRCVHFVEDVDYMALLDRLPRDIRKFHVEVLRLKTARKQTIRFVSDQKPRSFVPFSLESSPALAKTLFNHFGEGLHRIRADVSPEANRRVGGLYDGVRTLADMVPFMIAKSDPEHQKIVNDLVQSRQ